MSNRILTLAEELRLRLVTAHSPLEKRLRPGLTPEQSRQLAAKYKIKLTDEAVAYFSVLNGFDDPYAMPQQELWVLGLRWLDCLEDALEHYRAFWAFGEEHYADTYPEFWENDPVLTPPLRFMGEDSVYFYALDLRSEKRPIWSMDREMGMSVAFLSLEAMLATLNACLAEEVLVFRDGRWQKTNRERVRQIAEQLNPGVSRWQD